MSEKYKNKYRIKSARLATWDYANAGMYFITICTKNREHFFGRITDGKMELNAIGKIVNKEWIKTLELRPDMNLQMGEFVVMPNHFHAILIIGDNKYNTPIAIDADGCADDSLDADSNSNLNTDSILDAPADAMHCDSTPIPRTDAMHCDPTPIPRTDAMHCDSTPIPRTDAMHCDSTPIPRTDAMHCDSTPIKPKSGAIHSASTTTPTTNKFAPQSKNLASIIRGFKSSVTTYARKNGMQNFGWQSRFHDHIIRNEKSFQNISNYIINNPQKWEDDKFHK